MKRVKSFGVYQTSKVAAIILFITALIFMIPLGLMGTFILGRSIPGFPFIDGLFFIFFPFMYGIVGFIMTALGCLIYNLIAKWTGGIEFEIEVMDEINESAK
jgi:hypothetical protein